MTAKPTGHDKCTKDKPEHCSPTGKPGKLEWAQLSRWKTGSKESCCSYPSPLHSIRTSLALFSLGHHRAAPRHLLLIQRCRWRSQVSAQRRSRPRPGKATGETGDRGKGCLAERDRQNLSPSGTGPVPSSC